MGTVRESNRGVLLVVDMQVAVVESIWEGARVVKNVAPVAGARLRGEKRRPNAGYASNIYQ